MHRCYEVRRRNESIIKTFCSAAHVTCSKLKLNCTNPSYRVQVLQFPSRLLRLIIIHFYFPFFGWVLHLFSERFFSFFHFVIILLFYFPSFLHFRFIQSEKYSSYSLTIPSRHWCALFPLSTFEWVFYLKTCWDCERENPREEMKIF